MLDPGIKRLGSNKKFIYTFLQKEFFSVAIPLKLTKIIGVYEVNFMNLKKSM